MAPSLLRVVSAPPTAFGRGPRSARSSPRAGPPPRRVAAAARRPAAAAGGAALAPANAVAALAAAAAAALLAACPPSLAASPAALLADGGEQRPGVLGRLLQALPKPVQEDPFGADRAKPGTVADTKRPIPIITEQEAVAPEAFPNPSQDRSPKPPVLAAAESDEALGCNANQFEGLDETCRQALIDAKSPAQASRP